MSGEHRNRRNDARRNCSSLTSVVATVYSRAVAYFDGNRNDAIEWLKHPNPALAGETPLERANTAIGADDVIDLIGRMEHGIPT